MRKLTSLIVVALLAAPMAACDEQPTELSQQTQANELTQVSPDPSAAASANSNASNASSDAPHPIAQVRTWARLTDEWEFLVPQPLAPANENSTSPLYAIEAVDDPDSPHATAFFGPHDHVIPVQKQNRGTFSAMWHVHLVTDGPPEFDDAGLPTNLTNSADIDDDGNEELLTSFDRIQRAVEQGLVTSTGLPGVFFPCPVRSL